MHAYLLVLLGAFASACVFQMHLHPLYVARGQADTHTTIWRVVFIPALAHLAALRIGCEWLNSHTSSMYVWLGEYAGV
jgi:hypothetical protein